MPRVDASQPLLDAAERLFAEHGIAHVSDRKIAEAAGNSNHSAVRYYFGGRPGLLRALIQRHQEALEPLRRARFAESDSLVGDIRALVVPTTMVLAELPSPSWRARFLEQAFHDPETAPILGSAEHSTHLSIQVFDSIAARLAHLDPAIVSARASLMGHILATACARIEERVEHSGDTDEWSAAADFLCDAIAGMLEAPITRR